MISVSAWSLCRGSVMHKKRMIKTISKNILIKVNKLALVPSWKVTQCSCDALKIQQHRKIRGVEDWACNLVSEYCLDNFGDLFVYLQGNMTWRDLICNGQYRTF